MDTFFAIIGLVIAFFLIKKRESVGNSLGEYEWMSYVGGIYGVVIIVAILIFFWSLATLTGTQDFFFTPLRLLFPFLFKTAEPLPTDTNPFL
ncbi:MAG: hypothetical protein PHU04_02180 [Candidatus Peribacteraceae bacterium]|nr:hypothetical protein [Candidatus Peribacteraceae bacterium]